MIYISDQDIDRFLLEDIALGDLTTRSLKIEDFSGVICFRRRSAGRVSGVAISKKVLQKLNIEVDVMAKDGADVSAGDILIKAHGSAQALHQGWKVVQNILEWCGGVAQNMANLAKAAKTANPRVQIACTRKSIPGTRLLSTVAILDGGGIVHRCGTAETILLFANHRNFLPQPFDWGKGVVKLKQAAPEKKIVIEADTMEEAILAMQAEPDLVQLDKFTPEQIKECLRMLKTKQYRCHLAAAGGINLDNIADYAATDVALLVTSAPYYSKPADVKVVIEPIHTTLV